MLTWPCGEDSGEGSGFFMELWEVAFFFFSAPSHLLHLPRSPHPTLALNTSSLLAAPNDKVWVTSNPLGLGCLFYTVGKNRRIR